MTADADSELVGHIRWMATELLGDRVSRVNVVLRDHGAELSIGVVTPEGWRHAVAVDGPNTHPVMATRSACVAILAWLDAKAAHAAKG